MAHLNRISPGTLADDRAFRVLPGRLPAGALVLDENVGGAVGGHGAARGLRAAAHEL